MMLIRVFLLRPLKFCHERGLKMKDVCGEWYKTLSFYLMVDVVQNIFCACKCVGECQLGGLVRGRMYEAGTMVCDGFVMPHVFQTIIHCDHRHQLRHLCLVMLWFLMINDDGGIMSLSLTVCSKLGGTLIWIVKWKLQWKHTSVTPSIPLICTGNRQTSQQSTKPKTILHQLKVHD